MDKSCTEGVRQLSRLGCSLTAPTSVANVWSRKYERDGQHILLLRAKEDVSLTQS